MKEIFLFVGINLFKLFCFISLGITIWFIISLINFLIKDDDE